MVAAVDTPRKGLDYLVAGLGMMGSITPHIIEQAGGRIVGVLGINDEEAATFLKNNRFPNVRFAGRLDEYAEVLKKPHSEFNAVLIAVPNYLHADMGVAAAEAGKHVLIEKPLATNYHDAIRFFSAAIRSGVAAEINSQYRHHEVLGILRKMIDENEVEEVEMGYIQGWQANKTDSIGWRPEIAIAGRGKLVGDLGAHVLQTTFDLFGGNFVSFEGSTYNVHPKRFKPKQMTVSFDKSKRPGPEEAPDLWIEMDMLDPTKYSGDDRAEAHFELKTRKGQKVNGKYILSQVDPGDKVLGNENNFYIRVKFKDGSEARWFQEDPNHLDVLQQGKIYQRIERSSPPSTTGRPGGHPHGYGDAILLEVNKMMDVVESGNPGRIKAYTCENIAPAVKTVRMIEEWLHQPLQPYMGQSDLWLKSIREMRGAA